MKPLQHDPHIPQQIVNSAGDEAETKEIQRQLDTCQQDRKEQCSPPIGAETPPAKTEHVAEGELPTAAEWK
jgi:hypothetical protein